jgi:hypothetical protein
MLSTYASQRTRSNDVGRQRGDIDFRNGCGRVNHQFGHAATIVGACRRPKFSHSLTLDELADQRPRAHDRAIGVEPQRWCGERCAQIGEMAQQCPLELEVRGHHRSLGRRLAAGHQRLHDTVDQRGESGGDVEVATTDRVVVADLDIIDVGLGPDELS